MDWREEALNKLLTHGWDEYARAVDSGQKLEIETDLKDWVTHTLEKDVVLPLSEEGE